MAFLIGGANSAADTGYDVDNSCLFNDDDSAFMHKTPGSSSATKLWTFSCWIKLGNIKNSYHAIFSAFTGSSDQYNVVGLDGSNRVIFVSMDEGSGGVMNVISSAMLRDPSAWYHIVTAYDSAQGTAANRVKGYINGVQCSSFSTETYPDQNKDGYINSDNQHNVGKRWNANYFDGYMAEVVFIDGTAYAASDFGEFSEDSPTIWMPKDVSGLTFGTNGFYLDFKASDNLGNDANGGTDLTESALAATDQANDVPTNNFCVMNTLDKYWPTTGTAPAFSQGNLLVVGGSGSNSSTGYSYYTSTFGLAAGKWYWEVHITDIPAGGGQSLVGIIDVTQRYNQNLGEIVNATGIAWGIKNNGHVFNNNQGAAAETGTFAEGDTVGIALDITNSKMYFSKGGAWSDGNEAWDSTTFNASVGAVDITAVGSTHNGYWFVTVGGTEYSATTTWTLNFGSPVISISSGNADENGYGNFEYAVPDGFLAICTKNLGSAGG